jgi:hypothetical protein
VCVCVCVCAGRGVAGIHSHVGSGIHDPANWAYVGKSLFGLLQSSRPDGGWWSMRV